MRCICHDVLVVGTGCAGFNAADWLTDLGRLDTVIVTEGRYMGTSRNTGSDKQTYYKLSLCGRDADSIGEMADTLASGGDVDGPVALAEAAGSVPGFMKLALMGVPFPTDRYGQFAGYKTDHDPRQRATSAGPLTSRYMTEALERKVLAKHIGILDGYCIVKVIVEKNRLCGFIALYGNEPVYLKCNYAVWCTGGPAGIYQDVVYPESQRGMSGVLLDAGIPGCSLQHWQYGIASVQFRWNLSGTYQQVLPKYVSIDSSGTVHEFLREGLSRAQAEQNISYVFMKGYQWPFDSRKADASSSVDLAVYTESIVKGRKVYLDYRENPSDLRPDFSNLSGEAKQYLENSHALFGTPFERLQKMNPLAVELYKKHGIDLSRDLLEIKVCTQSHNGGIQVDENWKSSLDNLYVAGEAAGTFGAYRPGGTALNSSQVGSMRAALAICCTGGTQAVQPVLSAAEREHLDTFTKLFERKLHASENSLPHASETGAYFRSEMSRSAAFIRDAAAMKELEQKIKDTLCSYDDTVCFEKDGNPVPFYTVYDQLVTSCAVLDAMIRSAELYGSSGGAVVRGVSAVNDNGASHYRLVTVKSDGGFKTEKETVRPVPSDDTWFENVWAEYRKRTENMYGSINTI